MKQKYYLDSLLLLMMVVGTILAFSYIDRILDFITFGVFLLLSMVVNWRFRLVLKIPGRGKASVGERLQYLAMVIGKLLYIFYMINFIVAGAESRASLIFLIFIINMSGFLNLTYLAEDGLVVGFKKLITFSEILEIDRKKHYFDYYYCHVALHNGEVLKMNLSQEAIDECAKQSDLIIIKGENNE